MARDRHRAYILDWFNCHGGFVFRLIKLAVYVGIGYMLYELIQGFTAEQTRGGGGGSGSGGGQGRGNRAASDMNAGVRQGVGTMTGPGEGTRVETGEASGAGGSHVVGRGVI